jgi:hypothetical protein
MKIPHADLGYIVERCSELLQGIAEAWEDTGQKPAGVSPPEVVEAAFRQLFEILRGLEEAPAPDRPATGGAALGELGEYGLKLLAELASCASRLDQDAQAIAAESLALPFALYMARRGAELSLLEPVVNAVAALANHLSDPLELAHLFALIGEIVDAVSPSVSQDTDRSDPRRPWRLLLLNRAIVATRSHKPALMEVAFDAILEHLPEDAARFFEEGMAQMDALDYPPHVRAVMERYYLRQGGPPHTLH